MKNKNFHLLLSACLFCLLPILGNSTSSSSNDYGTDPREIGTTTSGSGSSMEPKTRADCLEEYDEIPGYKQQSSRAKDQLSCKGVVGESFCLTEKEDTYIQRCLDRSVAAAKAAARQPPVPSSPIEVRPLPDSSPKEKSDKNSKPRDANGFQEM